MVPAGRVKRATVEDGRASGAMTSDGGGLPPARVRSVSAEDGDGSAISEVEVVTFGADASKRFKPGSPVLDGAVRAKRRSRGKRKAASVSSGADGVARITGGPAAGTGALTDLKAVTDSLLGVVFDGGVTSSVARAVMEHAGRYEAILMDMVAENARLRGRLEVYEERRSGPGTRISAAAAPVVVPDVAPVAVSSPAPVVLPKPVDTWAVVVRGGKKGKEASKEVVRQVVEEVGPTLGVRVHEVRPTRDGGAVIRTPSVAERQRIVRNGKFEELGLRVSVEDRLGPRVVVQGVHPEVKMEEFVADLYELNLKDRMSREEFSRGVKVVSRPWKPDLGPVNVVLEGTVRAMSALLDVGRCYIKWFSFRVRSYEPVLGCHRCLGFDHRVKDCRFKEDVCRRCGRSGHIASRCANAVNCRNCAFKGLPSGHMMLTAACPTYAMLVARANARH